MRTFILLFALLATPALAHHEVVVATSMLPVMGGLAVIAVAGMTALRDWWRKRRHS